LYPLLRSFQRYVARPLPTCNLRWFLTFNGRKSIDTSIVNLYFSHNLCCKYSNGSCEFILNIYVSRYFQWYKKLFNLSFDPSNHSLTIRKCLGILIPKIGVHLRMCGFIHSHFLALSGVGMWLLGCIFGLHLSMPFALVTNPRLKL
jgi:hypothetical protein